MFWLGKEKLVKKWKESRLMKHKWQNEFCLSFVWEADMLRQKKEKTVEEEKRKYKIKKQLSFYFFWKEEKQ